MEKNLVLHFGIVNNLSEYRERMFTACEKKFGNLARVIKTGDPYVVTKIKREDYLPDDEDEDDEDAVVLTATQLGLLKVEAIKRKKNEASEMESNHPKFYASLWESLSDESKIEVEQHELFVAADEARNPNMLWKIIEETHRSNIRGCAVSRKLLEQEQFSEELASMKQNPGENVGTFHSRFGKKLVQVKEVKGRIPQTEADEAYFFLCKLDATRFGPMLAALKNDAVSGKNGLPITVQKAYEVAASWSVAVVPTGISNHSSMQSVLTLCDDRVMVAGKFSGGVKTDADKLAKEIRTCYICLKKGHIAKDCPSKIEKKAENKVLIFGEIDEEDEYY